MFVYLVLTFRSGVSSYQSSMKHARINYLNSHITQLLLIKNLIETRADDLDDPEEANEDYYDETILTHTSLELFNKSAHKLRDTRQAKWANLVLAKMSLNVNEKFRKKIFLGQLFTRNFLSILLNFLERFNDFVLFYTKPQKLLLFSLNQFDQLISLLEPAICLIKIQIISQIKVRKMDFKDLSSLGVLFKFYGIFNYTIQNSIMHLKQSQAKSKKRRLTKSSKHLFNSLVNKYNMVNKNLYKTFLAFTINFNDLQPTRDAQEDKSTLKFSLYTGFYRELAKYTTEMPFNFVYGLNLLTNFLPAPLPILLDARFDACLDRAKHTKILNERKLLTDHVASLFMNEKINSINLFIEPKGVNGDHSAFVSMVRVLSLTSPKTKLNALFKRVCVQLSDLSDLVCSHLIRTILDYGIELLDRIKFDNDFIEIEEDLYQVANEALNKMETNTSEVEESIYDTKTLYDEHMEFSDLRSEDDSTTNKVVILYFTFSGLNIFI